MEHIFNITSVSDYCSLRNYEVQHPLISVVDYSKFKEGQYTNKNYDAFRFGCYAIFLKDSTNCKLKYGGKSYDYDEGTLVFIGLDQIVGISNDSNYAPKGYALLIHPDLFLGTGMKKKINKYNFFSYSVNEALHLSAKERRVILSLLEKITYELEQSIDKYSKKLIISNIELFLDYCVRFYDRQFITRETVNKSFIEKFEGFLNEYFVSDEPQKYGTPSVGYFADKLHVSPNYFGDLVKKETGTSAQEYIQNKLIEVAKERVFDPNKSVSEIAFELGFKYPQHFSRIFKQKVGVSPNEFRMLN